MPTPASLGWASAISSLAGAVPGIARQYSLDSKAQEDEEKKKLLKASTQKILRGIPKYGSALEEISSGMDPVQAQEALSRTSPQDQKDAVDIMTGKRGLDAMNLQMPKTIPQPATPAGGALGALSQPPSNPRHKKNAFVRRFMDALGAIESGGQDIGAHPRAKNGAQAWGRLGVVPEFHAQRVGLDPKNPADIAKFKADPTLQEQAAEDFVRELGEKYDWDPAMMRRGYYGITADNDAAQGLFDGRSMPSSNEDNEKFMRFFGDMERPAQSMGAPADLPWDNSLLSNMLKDPPRMKTMPRKVTRGDQLAYILENTKNPEQYGQLKDMVERYSKLAEREDKEKEDIRAGFEKEQDRYGDNVRADADLKFKTWKERQEQAHRVRTYKDQSISALRTQRESLQKQLTDIRGFQTRVSAGKEKPEVLAAAYPDFFQTKTKDPGYLAQLWNGDEADPVQETVFDNTRFSDEVKKLQADIDAVDQALSSKSGASVSAPAAAVNPMSKYLTPKKKD